MWRKALFNGCELHVFVTHFAAVMNLGELQRLTPVSTSATAVQRQECMPREPGGGSSRSFAGVRTVRFKVHVHSHTMRPRLVAFNVGESLCDVSQRGVQEYRAVYGRGYSGAACLFTSEVYSFSRATPIWCIWSCTRTMQGEKRLSLKHSIKYENSFI